VDTEVSVKIWQELKNLGMITNDYSEYLKLCRKRAAKLSSLEIPRRRDIRLAIVGAANTDLLPELIEFTLDSQGLGCKILNTPFNTYAHEMFDPESNVANFNPDVTMVVNSPFNQPHWPNIAHTSEHVGNLCDQATEFWLNLCRSLHENTGCEIIFDNFHQFPWRPHGNLSAKLPFDINNFLKRLNRNIAANSYDYLHINDVDWLASNYGVSNWIDLKYWNHAKLPMSLKYIVHYVKNISAIISSIYGGSKKVLVLDLDNTLWGGVIGDDGLNGIVVGQGSAQGEAFVSFQKYIQQLKDRGILLAVCSKNEEANAKLPFEDHPEMVLKLDDFVCFVANWEPKPNNIIQIAEKLNLGMGSFVFIDDNPVERELMRTQLPDVLTIELGNDPVEYPAIIDNYSPFELTSLSAEDLTRSDKYKENFNREALKTKSSNYNDYLALLEQKARILPFEESRLERITQLINKTNQFNLTTIRKSRTEVAEIMSSPRHFSTYIQLADKFGDNGIISVLFGIYLENTLDISCWLMSCRVLKRQVEAMACNYLVEHAKKTNKRFITGTYIPTDKNNMVSGLYESLGFELVESLDDGTTKWKLDIQKYKNAEHFIKIERG